MSQPEQSTPTKAEHSYLAKIQSDAKLPSGEGKGQTVGEHSLLEQKMRTGPETPLPCCVDFAIYPLGSTKHFSEYIDQVEAILKQLGLKYKVHEQGTIIEGEMMAVMHAVKCCHNAIHSMGSPRIVSNIRVDTGSGKYKDES
ncbi:hypothetical protein BC939DRAFT_457536 [Gamsiella multidivaricata]|uniref:uncharacterized protein n=1 Tax=Gamsiella multidivaricata TaxID=101098 RepID=UPI0022206A6C|nr:uncharacterized protein BC939DRAFT_457536 [Gamsiella multidivaricata]KAI7820509.1 hypothetical protein BC939DRAFT_457536 [Gamsiella multidivaricata]